MIYVISDIHGCYEELMELLKLIHFSDKDELYVLGDIMDRGPKPIAVIEELMQHSNAWPILGNHDYMALKLLEKLDTEVTESFLEGLSEETMKAFQLWMKDGGEVTVQQYTKLDEDGREAILDYLKECTRYEGLMVDNRRYVLVHAGMDGFSPEKALEDYRYYELIFNPADYHRRYFPQENTFLITGHTPTRLIREDKKDLIYEENGHIAIDCGCVYGGKLAAYCLNTQTVTYVDSRQKCE